jgi:hypothetical protein
MIGTRVQWPFAYIVIVLTRMRYALIAVLTMTSLAGAQAGGLKPNAALCPAVVGLFPTERIDEDTPVNRLARFEVRMCSGGFPVQLLGFKRNEIRPSMFINTEQSGISLLIQTGTVLLLQVSAGSSSPIYIVQMKKGTPVLVSREDSVGGVSYREQHDGNGDFVVFTVPQKTFPDPTTGTFPKVPPHEIRLKIYD